MKCKMNCWIDQDVYEKLKKQSGDEEKPLSTLVNSILRASYNLKPLGQEGLETDIYELREAVKKLERRMSRLEQ